MVVAATLAASLTLGIAAAPEADERAVLRSARAGSLDKPRTLTTEALDPLCEEDVDATRAVYRTRIPSTGFGFGAYEAGALPLALDRPLLALEGAALLSADERDAAFTVDATVAEDLRDRRHAKALELEVTFRLAEADVFAPCFTQKGSGQWALHVEVLAYALHPADGAPLARLETDALNRLRAWVQPGDAKVRIEARSVGGAVDDERATVALGSAREAIEVCTARVREAVTDPVTLAYVADVAATGKVDAVRPELVTADLDAEVGCIEKALVAVELPRAKASYRARIVVALDRPGFEALYW